MNNDIHESIYALTLLGYTIVNIGDRYYSCTSFYPAGRSSEYHDLVGRDITNLLRSQFVGFTTSSVKQTQVHGTIDSQIENLPKIRVQYHKDVLWNQALPINR